MTWIQLNDLFVSLYEGYMPNDTFVIDPLLSVTSISNSHVLDSEKIFFHTTLDS